MMLDDSRPDRFGIPQVRFDIQWRENEANMLADSVKQAVAMLEAAGCTDIESRTEAGTPGRCIHAMGTARMGRDTASSVGNEGGRSHDVRNTCRQPRGGTHAVQPDLKAPIRPTIRAPRCCGS